MNPLRSRRRICGSLTGDSLSQTLGKYSLLNHLFHKFEAINITSILTVFCCKWSLIIARHCTLYCAAFSTACEISRILLQNYTSKFLFKVWAGAEPLASPIRCKRTGCTSIVRTIDFFFSSCEQKSTRAYRWSRSVLARPIYRAS